METTKSQVVPISWCIDKLWQPANLCSLCSAWLTQWLQPSCLLTKFHGATERSVHKITAKLADISVWASFHRICPVVATGVTACRLQSRLSRMAIKLGWLSEYPAQVRLNAFAELLF